MSRDLIDAIFNSVDEDGAGTVDYEEFIVTCTASYMLQKPKALNAIYYFLGPDPETKTIKAIKVVKKIERFTSILIPRERWLSVLN